ncbi:HMG box transcription factor BBX [Spea bombifrons]|uniref:HMG box transcription factor BBX n=1 Tax=Spea bombifrons TaxID=233779 RepID=UPI002349945B|nr:HMG box transcription factor BBX [Spea bombifrons]
MKGSTRNKDHSTEGEGTGKRPKRKCLQWHPLLANKILDFSEEDEEEEDEEDVDKVQLVDADSLEQDVDEAEDNESPEQRARRPMNAFLLFCKRHRSLVRQEHPRLDNRGATKILADWWAFLDPNEKQKYTDMAKEYKDAFMKANPGYKWCPTTNKPVKPPSPNVATRKKIWPYPPEAVKELPSPKNVSKGDEMPQLNFGIADPTQMGGLSMLLLAGEHALTAQGDHALAEHIESSVTEVSSSVCKSKDSDSSPPSRNSEFFQFAEISSSTSHSDVPTPAKRCEKSALFQFAEISSNTSQIDSLEPSKRCGKSALFHLAEISSNTSHSDSPASTKQCGTSALFQLAEMCVASEAVKIETSGDVNTDTIMVQNPLCLKETKSEASDDEVISSSLKDYSHVCKKNEFGHVKVKKESSASTNPSETEFLGLLKREKNKKKKKKSKIDHDVGEKISPKKSCKKRQSSESDIESVMYTIEAVAKGDWGDEMPLVSPSKKVCCGTSPNHHFSDVKQKKKKLKSKEKKVVKDKFEKFTEAAKELVMPEPINCAPVLKESTDMAQNVKDEALSPTEEVPPVCLPEILKPEDCSSNKKIEACGSRKSERSCKGALYKTLVSEGMLTTLRANVDRGKRNSGKGNSSDHEGWNEDSWGYSQTGLSGSKKLKKAKPSEESAVGLAKLEEEFEKKFNSLPQYSPVTFDRKNVSVPRKKKKSGNGQNDQKTNKGTFQSQKKNLFHKIVSKYKNKKDKQSISDKAILEDKTTRDSSGSSHFAPVPNIPEPIAIQEPLVGSQKRKARKNKITHLVRHVEGQSSTGVQGLEEQILSNNCQKNDNKNDNCKGELVIPGEEEVDQNHSISQDMPSVSAFFSLAALAEVAAMENIHRNPRTTHPCDGQKKDMPQSAVLISCADQ